MGEIQGGQCTRLNSSHLVCELLSNRKTRREIEMSNKKTVFSSFRDQLREFEEEIDRLDEKSRAFDNKLKKEFKRHAGDFKEIVEDGKVNVDRLRELTEAEFDRFKDNLEFTAKALRKSFAVFVEQFDESSQPKWTKFRAVIALG